MDTAVETNSTLKRKQGIHDRSPFPDQRKLCASRPIKYRSEGVARALEQTFVRARGWKTHAPQLPKPLHPLEHELYGILVNPVLVRYAYDQLFCELQQNRRQSTC